SLCGGWVIAAMVTSWFLARRLLPLLLSKRGANGGGPPKTAAAIEMCRSRVSRRRRAHFQIVTSGRRGRGRDESSLFGRRSCVVETSARVVSLRALVADTPADHGRVQGAAPR